MKRVGALKGIIPVVLVLPVIATVGGSSGHVAGCSCEISSPDRAAVHSDAVVVGVATDFKALIPWWQYLIEGLGVDAYLESIGIRWQPDVPDYEGALRILYSWNDPAADSTLFRWRRYSDPSEHPLEYGPELKVRTPGWCFTSYFEVGHLYLVYAYWPSPSVDMLWTTYCDGTRPIEYARYDLLVLGEPVSSYKLSYDALTLVTGPSLSEREKREVLVEAAERIIGLSFDVREKHAGGYGLWCRPNQHVEWAPAGTITGSLIENNDWAHVTEELRALRVRVYDNWDSLFVKKRELRRN